MPDERRRWDDVRVEIRAAVADAMMTARLTLDRHEAQLLKLWATVYGDETTRQQGLVALFGAMDSKLDQIIAQRQQTIWLMRGVAVGLAINLAESTGFLPWLVRVFERLSAVAIM